MRVHTTFRPDVTPAPPQAPRPPRRPREPRRQGKLRREHIYDRPVVDGRVASQGVRARLRRWWQAAVTSSTERADADLERRLGELPRSSRPNVIGVMSPKGGVGKTSVTFAVGSLFGRLGHRTLAIDMNPDSGTLGGLVPERDRADGRFEDLLEHAGEVRSGAELGRYVSRLSSGLHVLASSRDLDFMATLTPQRYGSFLGAVAPFYDLLLLDLGTGIANGVPRFALDVADQVVVVTTPDWTAVEISDAALRYLEQTLADRPLTVALNLVDATQRTAITANLERALGQAIGTTITIPRDEQLRLMLDSGTYNLDALPRPTRLALRRLGLALGERIV